MSPRRTPHPASRPSAAQIEAVKRRRGQGSPPPSSGVEPPPPAACPRCGGELLLVPTTPTGLRPWMCRTCRVVGHSDRIVGDPLPAVLPRAKRGRPVHEGHQFIRRPRASHVDDDYARADEPVDAAPVKE